MPAYALGAKTPKIHPSVMIAPNATIIGDVTVGAKTSIWPGAVLRGDYGRIRIGRDCSIQDNVVVHCDVGNPGLVGDGVTVAHSAIIHACRIGDECLIGAGAIVFDGAKVGTHSILGVGTVVLEGRTIPGPSDNRGKIPVGTVIILQELSGPLVVSIARPKVTELFLNLVYSCVSSHLGEDAGCGDDRIG